VDSVKGSIRAARLLSYAKYLYFLAPDYNLEP
jgi:hypothetical protein